MIQRPCIEGIEEMRVCELLNEDLVSWNEGMVRGMFVEEEAKDILNIPLSFRLREDKSIWVLNRLGRYIVKSTYIYLGGGVISHTVDLQGL